MTGVKGARFVIAIRMGDGTVTFSVFVLKVSIFPQLLNISKNPNYIHVLDKYINYLYYMGFNYQHNSKVIEIEICNL